MCRLFCTEERISVSRGKDGKGEHQPKKKVILIEMLKDCGREASHCSCRLCFM